VKILLYGINFAPEMTGVGKYTSEMASWLAKKGHSVRVVTAPPYYPDWRIFDGFSSIKYRTECWQGVRVYRCPLWVPSTPTGVTRVVHLLSFALSSLPRMLSQIFWRPDVVWVVEPSFFCSPMALIVSRLCGAKSVLHVQDFELDAAFQLGLLKGSLLRRMVTSAESFILKRFDVVSTISKKMLERLHLKGVSPARSLLFNNWADLTSSATGDGGRLFRESLRIPANAVVALYSGNMGRKQGLELLSEIARALVDESDVFFVFCGGGVGRSELQAGCEGIANVRFLDLQPVELLPELLGMADIHLLPQRSDASDLVMPSKLCGMLASGKPVIATAVEGSELESIIRECGIVVQPGDWRAAADAVLRLARSRELAAQLGRAGRQYSESHLARDTILDSFLQRMTERPEFARTNAT
jgi:colanic acid biosynthesis glycosyl transferase WcaI